MALPHSRRTATAFAALTSAVPLSLLVAAPAAAEPLPIPTGKFQSGVYLPLNDWPVAGSGPGALLLNGNLSLTWADSSLSPTLDENDQLTALETEFGLRGAVTPGPRRRDQRRVRGHLRTADASARIVPGRPRGRHHPSRAPAADQRPGGPPQFCGELVDRDNDDPSLGRGRCSVHATGPPPQERGSCQRTTVFARREETWKLRASGLCPAVY